MSDFETLWREWIPHDMPKGDKARARKSYEKAVKDTDHEIIIRGAARYLAECRQFNVKSKHVVTWINQRGWENETSVVCTKAINGRPTRKAGLQDAVNLASRIMAARRDNKGLGAPFD